MKRTTLFYPHSYQPNSRPMYNYCAESTRNTPENHFRCRQSDQKYQHGEVIIINSNVYLPGTVAQNEWLADENTTQRNGTPVADLYYGTPLDLNPDLTSPLTQITATPNPNPIINFTPWVQYTDTPAQSSSYHNYMQSNMLDAGTSQSEPFMPNSHDPMGIHTGYANNSGRHVSLTEIFQGEQYPTEDEIQNIPETYPYYSYIHDQYLQPCPGLAPDTTLTTHRDLFTNTSAPQNEVHKD
ncbi:hypothetical protein BDQ17DRAFT_1514307 [Cyathus striatus]|nr:hypothetical protein BDQ17DRAFT_1514307 [Cyathus striatus]